MGQFQRINTWKAVATTLFNICKRQNQARYYVYRGPVNWAQFDFNSFPFALSIICDQRTFNRAINTATITLELFTRIPDSQVDTGLNDTIADELGSDLQDILLELTGAKFPGSPGGPNDDLIMRLHAGSDTLLEASDTSLKVQGVLATITVDY